MKAIETPTEAQKRRLEQAVYQDSLDSMSDNLAISLITLNKEFGFGERRLRKFLRAISKNVAWFRSFDDNALAQEKIFEELRDIGIDPDEIYYKEDIILFQQARKKAKAVSIKEAAEIQKQLAQMKALL